MDAGVNSTNPNPQNPNGRLIDPDATQDERTYTMWLHLSMLGASVFGVLFFAPLVMWLIKKDESKFIDDHGREATNFMISLVLYYVGTGIIALVTCGVGAALVGVVYVFGIVGSILAALASNRGEYYRYPMTIRLLS